MPTHPMFTRCALVALLAVSSAVAADWPNWRGPNYDGISPEKGFQTKWDKEPPVVWERELGSAFSAFVCVGDKVYTCGTADKQQMLLCLNADTGATVWQTPIEGEYRERQGGDGTRATPTVHDGRVYILGAQGHLLCCDAASGKEIWSRQFDAMPRWGYSGSVLIEGAMAVVTAGGKDGALLAVDAATGKDLWRCGRDPVGYATPYAFTLEGKRYVAGFMGEEVVVADAQTGQEVWKVAWKTDWNVNAATPLFSNGTLFISSGYNHGGMLYRLTPAKDGLAGQPAWKDVSKSIRAKFQSPVLYDGYLYASEQEYLRCVDFATGQEKWTQKGIKDSTVLLADGHLIVLTEDGELQIAPVSPEKYAPITKVKILSGRCWTIPTLYQGRLYVRNLKLAKCYDLRAKQ